MWPQSPAPKISRRIYLQSGHFLFLFKQKLIEFKYIKQKYKEVRNWRNERIQYTKIIFSSLTLKRPNLIFLLTKFSRPATLANTLWRIGGS